MTTNLPAPLRKVITTWQALGRIEQMTLIAALIAAVSPFLPWFHSCLRRPGVYSCTTWNGWQFDNDIFGSLIFVSAAAIIFTLLWPTSRPLDLPLSLKQIRRLASPILFALGLIRLLTFQGESSESTTIGINMGLVILIVASLVLLLLSEWTLVQRLRQILMKRISGGPLPVIEHPEAALHHHDLDEMEAPQLDDIVSDEPRPLPPKQQPLI